MTTQHTHHDQCPICGFAITLRNAYETNPDGVTVYLSRWYECLNDDCSQEPFAGPWCSDFFDMGKPVDWNEVSA